MEYKYVALNKEGNRLSGVVSAHDSASARRFIVQQNLDIISLRQKGSSLFNFFSNSRASKLKARELITILLNIGELDKLGMSMIDIIQILKDDVSTNSRMKGFCKKIYSAVKGGATLGEAFEQNHGYVDKVYANIVKIGEDTGSYHEVFERIIKYIKSSDKINRTIKNIVRKGVVSMLFIFTLIVAISLVIIPKTVSFLKENGMAIPWYTQSMINMSEFIVKKYPMFITLLLIVGGLFYLMIKLSYFFKVAIDKMKLKIPVIGPLIRQIETARFITFFSIMYDCGIRIEVIFARVKDVVRNKYMQKRLLEADKMIMNGRLPQDAIARTAPFSNQIIKMMSVGFSSGNISEVIKNTAYFLEQDIDERVDWLVSSIRPALMILTGLLVGWMAIAVFGPIYTNLGSFANDNQQGIRQASDE